MRKSAPPPPPPKSTNGSSTFVDDSDSMSVESLEGRMRLSVLLPDGRTFPMEIERRTAMLDLLVQVTKANNFNPVLYYLDAKNDNQDTIHYKPNTAIGSLNASAVHLVAKSQAREAICPSKESKQGSKPFEETFRLRVHLPRNQLHVLRVSPQTPLSVVFATICNDRCLSPERFELRHPVHIQLQLDLRNCLSDYNLAEVAVVSLKETDGVAAGFQNMESTSVQLRQDDGRKKSGIFSFFRKSKSSVVELSDNMRNEYRSKSEICLAQRDVSSDHRPKSVISVSSDSSANSALTTQSKAAKKRQAPLPPLSKAELTAESKQKATSVVELVQEVTEETIFTSHSRHSSDSSGYHESSILSDSPENNGLDVESASHHNRFRKAMSTTNISSVGDSSSLSVSAAAAKKRKAPLPPSRSSTLPATSNPAAPISEGLIDTERQNGDKVCRRDSLSSETSSIIEERLDDLPVSKPATVEPEVRCRVDIDSSSGEADSKHHGDLDNQGLEKLSELAAAVESESESEATVKNNLYHGRLKSEDCKSEALTVEENGSDVLDENAKNIRKSSLITECSTHHTFVSLEKEVRDEDAVVLQSNGLVEVSSSMCSETKVETNGLDLTSEDTVNVADLERDGDAEDCRSVSTTDEGEKNTDFENEKPSQVVSNVETSLEDALNEFHNSNSAKQPVTDLWSHVVALPHLANSCDLDSGENNLNSDSEGNLSLAEEDFDTFDRSNGVASTVTTEIHKSSANTLHENEIEEHSEKCVGFLERCDGLVSSVEGDAMNWEYKMPAVPPVARNDVTENGETGHTTSSTATGNKVMEDEVETRRDKSFVNNETETSGTTLDNASSDAWEGRSSPRQSDIPASRQVYKKPVVRFSISTYKSRATVEHSYEDKLGKSDLPSAQQTKTTTKSTAKPEPPVVEIVKNDRLDSSSTKLLCVTESIQQNVLKRSELQLSDRLADGSCGSVVGGGDQEKLQEEYAKLHKQFLQWQKQLLNNQSLLQKELIIPPAATDALQPLQEFQNQFTSLPPMNVDYATNKTDCNKLKDEILPVSRGNVPSRDTGYRLFNHGPRPWKPVNVNLSSWNQRSKDSHEDGYASLDSRFTSRDLQPEVKSHQIHRTLENGAGFHEKSLDNTSGDGKDSLQNTDGHLRQTVKERMQSFNLNVNAKPLVTVNRQASHVASFPRYPVVKGFATLPAQTVTKSFSGETTTNNNVSRDPIIEIVNGTKGTCAKSIKSGKGLVTQKSNTLDSFSRNRDNVKTLTYFGDPIMPLTGSRMSSKTNGSVASRDTVVNIVDDKSTERKPQPVLPQPPPPPPKDNKQAANSREELMHAIRDFGGRCGLRKVSAVDTRWQARHGGVR